MSDRTFYVGFVNVEKIVLLQEGDQKQVICFFIVINTCTVLNSKSMLKS